MQGLKNATEHSVHRKQQPNDILHRILESILVAVARKPLFLNSAHTLRFNERPVPRATSQCLPPGQKTGRSSASNTSSSARMIVTAWVKRNREMSCDSQLFLATLGDTKALRQQIRFLISVTAVALHAAIHSVNYTPDILSIRKSLP